jgi:acyl dehydratase
MARIINARDTRFGGYLEDYEVGDRYIHWPGKTITQAEDHMFCMITLAASPIHVDSNYASTEMSGGHNLVVGSFIYSLLLGMSVPDISGRAIANLGVEKLRHIAPMYHGDTLYGETTVEHVRTSKSRPATGILTAETTGYNQDKKVVCTFSRSVLLPKRDGR